MIKLCDLDDFHGDDHNHYCLDVYDNADHSLDVFDRCVEGDGSPDHSDDDRLDAENHLHHAQLPEDQDQQNDHQSSFRSVVRIRTAKLISLQNQEYH